MKPNQNLIHSSCRFSCTISEPKTKKIETCTRERRSWRCFLHRLGLVLENLCGTTTQWPIIICHVLKAWIWMHTVSLTSMVWFGFTWLCYLLHKYFEEFDFHES